MNVAVQMTPEQKFGKTMRALRQRAGYTQVEMAEQMRAFGIRLDPSAVTRIEQGGRSVRLNEAVAMARILCVSLPDVLDSSCLTCFGSPPAGFTCQGCGSSS